MRPVPLPTDGLGPPRRGTSRRWTAFASASSRSDLRTPRRRVTSTSPPRSPKFEQRLPGMADISEPDDPGMHTTDTVDFDFVVSGEVYLELDDGAEVLLKPGDCVVQNGTRHRWNNRSNEPCVIAVCHRRRRAGVTQRAGARVAPTGLTTRQM